jgi:hypothetical protein
MFLPVLPWRGPISPETREQRCLSLSRTADPDISPEQTLPRLKATHVRLLAPNSHSLLSRIHTRSLTRSGRWPEQQTRRDREVTAAQGENHHKNLEQLQELGAGTSKYRNPGNRYFKNWTKSTLNP